jgi:hypothetical protein
LIILGGEHGLTASGTVTGARGHDRTAAAPCFPRSC